jgi:hypothetical protein
MPYGGTSTSRQRGNAVPDKTDAQLIADAKELTMDDLIGELTIEAKAERFRKIAAELDAALRAARRPKLRSDGW